MALTNAQKASVRLYLGYPNIFRYKHTRLESCLDDVSGDPDAEAQVTGLLIGIAAEDTIVNNAVTAIAGGGGVKKVDEIEFFSPNDGQLETLEAGRVRGRELIGRLSTILGVPIASDYFGQQGYPGDAFSEGGDMGGRSPFGGPYNLG